MAKKGILHETVQRLKAAEEEEVVVVGVTSVARMATWLGTVPTRLEEDREVEDAINVEKRVISLVTVPMQKVGVEAQKEVVVTNVEDLDTLRGNVQMLMEKEVLVVGAGNPVVCYELMILL